MSGTYDVLIVGSGAAGMMAGLTVAEAGCSCLVLEKGEKLTSSNACRAGGPALAGTKTQTDAGVEVTPQQLFSHMFGFSRGTVHPTLLRNAINEGPLVERWMMECGVEWELMEDTYGVGFRARHLFKTPPSERWESLAQKLRSLGGEIKLGAAAVALLQDKTGAVIGVRARENNEERCYYAPAVVIATGGYLGDVEMMRTKLGGVAVNALGTKLSDGGGIRLAKSVGAVLDRNWGICANEFGGYNHKHKGFSSWLRYAIQGGLLVDPNGERFMNEQLLSDEPLSVGGELSLRAGRFYAVVDQAMVDGLREQSLYDFCGRPEDWHAGKTTHSRPPMRFGAEPEAEQLIAEDWISRGETIEAAAEPFGLTQLAKTVERYNAICEAGEDVQFGKSAYLLHPLATAPYYIVEFEPSAWCTFGGVKTDGHCRALNVDQRPIPGLYVAGVDNGSAYCVPYYDNEGAALGIAFTTGIVAGKVILDDIK